MKWFKHFSDANADDKLVSIRDKFGMWGVGTYWTLVEMVAVQMKGNNPVPEATFSMVELCSVFGCKRTKLVSFLKHLQNIRGMIVKHSRNVPGMNRKPNRNILKINIPNLLKIKDNYTKDLEETSKRLPSIEVEEEVEEEKKKKEIVTLPREGVFLDEKVWAAWETFRAYRSERKKPLTPRSEVAARKRVQELSRGSYTAAVRIIEQSVANSWQGIFELKQKELDEILRQNVKDTCPHCHQDVMNLQAHLERGLCLEQPKATKESVAAATDAVETLKTTWRVK